MLVKLGLLSLADISFDPVTAPPCYLSVRSNHNTIDLTCVVSPSSVKIFFHLLNQAKIESASMATDHSLLQRLLACAVFCCSGCLFVRLELLITHNILPFCSVLSHVTDGLSIRVTSTPIVPFPIRLCGSDQPAHFPCATLAQRSEGEPALRRIVVAGERCSPEHVIDL